MRYQFKVKIITENKTKYKIKLMATNRTLYVDKDTFSERIQQGVYELVGERPQVADAK